MSQPQSIPPRKRNSPERSPVASPNRSPFLIPSPASTRRTRTYSANERALAGPSYIGRVKEFCRERGHGFIIPRDGGEPLFVHISDIDGDFVPKAGDEVKFKRCPVPPKNEKFCAVHVSIVHPAEGVSHETWEEAVEHQRGSHS